VHVRTGTVVAIKVVPIENDLEDIVREVTVMNGLQSEYIVQLYGSYLKDANLWVRTYREIERETDSWRAPTGTAHPPRGALGAHRQMCAGQTARRA
jgi:hypothetical protein